MPPFDPQRLTPTVSLNRVHIVDLPGLRVDPEVKGRTGYELVSLAALARFVRHHADALQLDPNAPDHELRLAIEDCLISDCATVRATAEKVARRIGRNLGYVLLTLKRGDPVNRAARREWDDSYWCHWGHINHIWLGGGLVGGRLGLSVGQHAQDVIEEAGISHYTVRISPYASVLPLAGVSRYAPSTCSTALVCDFGNTMIKCARAIYRDGGLIALQPLPARAAGLEEMFQALNHPVQRAIQLLRHMVSVITDGWHVAGLHLPSTILACIAAYMEDGHPMPSQGGGYYQLRRITHNLQSELVRQVSTQLGKAVNVLLFHDGTAAATTYAGMENTAVIMMGTALGVGFPPPADNLRDMNMDLAVLGIAWKNGEEVPNACCDF